MVRDREEAAGPPGPEAGSAAYDDFAWLYDQFWSRGIPLLLLQGVERLLLPYLPPGGRVLDLCCGTGRIAAALGERGYRVTGVDASAGMLRLASRNAPAAALVCADARSFRLAEPCDGAVCLFDSLNHVLSLAELGQVFRNVFDALVPEGRFIFDLNTETAFERHWRGDLFSSVGPDHASIMRGTYDPAARIARCEVTLFQPLGETWQRSDLTIVERCHDVEEVRGALAEAGFREVERYDAAGELGLAGQEGRVFLAARK
jgi:SAM-dependent methyltransferase